VLARPRGQQAAHFPQAQQPRLPVPQSGKMTRPDQRLQEEAAYRCRPSRTNPLASHSRPPRTHCCLPQLAVLERPRGQQAAHFPQAQSSRLLVPQSGKMTRPDQRLEEEAIHGCRPPRTNPPASHRRPPRAHRCHPQLAVLARPRGQQAAHFLQTQPSRLPVPQSGEMARPDQRLEEEAAHGCRPPRTNPPTSHRCPPRAHRCLPQNAVLARPRGQQAAHFLLTQPSRLLAPQS